MDHGCGGLASYAPTVRARFPSPMASHSSRRAGRRHVQIHQPFGARSPLCPRPASGLLSCRAEARRSCPTAAVLRTRLASPLALRTSLEDAAALLLDIYGVHDPGPVRGGRRGCDQGASLRVARGVWIGKVRHGWSCATLATASSGRYLACPSQWDVCRAVRIPKCMQSLTSRRVVSNLYIDVVGSVGRPAGVARRRVSWDALQLLA
ncbi:hypothetical protein DAEQUDRAFT_469051 [Daedalea quercina L-15889]|uniref:Uncharacterized protein n=1 Tax=Daedalea quercina L-15889 TaxID=1314783 RepID=A0A165TGM4_9APHY|nr:hypothetical protein DAEQUDRAFT_469051 [Daedalea quercina L-15889]